MRVLYLLPNNSWVNLHTIMSISQEYFCIKHKGWSELDVLFFYRGSYKYVIKVYIYFWPWNKALYAKDWRNT